MSTPVTTTVDARFGDDGEPPLPWSDTEELIESAQLYWLSTVRRDGVPHVTPLIGLWHAGGFVFCTGPGEQKTHNLRHNDAVAVTTGVATWAAGTDVVVEGRAHRVTDGDALHAVAEAYYVKYGQQWRFEVHGDAVGPVDDPGWVFRVVPSKVLVFAKGPFGQTTHRFA